MAIQIRRGTNASWESNYSNIVDGEPAITLDTGRFMVGTGSGIFSEFANIEILADDFSIHKSYIVGELTTYGGKVNKCTTPHEGEWVTADFEQVISLSDGVLSASEYLELASLMASAYSTSATYFQGQFATHGGNVYEAKQEITTAESWTASHWNLIGSVS